MAKTDRWDVIVVGAGPAGLSAALILGRCLRRVLVVDTDAPRNGVSRALHGFLTRDGIPPRELRRIGRQQLARYKTVHIERVEARRARRVGRAFEVTLGDGRRLRCRKLLLATGVVDAVPSKASTRCMARASFTAPTATDGSSATSPRRVLFFGAPQQQHCDLASRLGCAFTSKGAVRTGKYEATDIPGLYVAGDASHLVQMAIVAAAEGAQAAFAINTALLKEDSR